ncbi:XRE family transcriptional regulator [Polymorphospora sp. NPDC050346]|uniref:helix-turn-helix domain-containing protein n=1 Tax=Polymorphospora sp. NPDC050346 TaxID=3155780 RepID=UPI0033E0F3B3
MTTQSLQSEVGPDSLAMRLRAARESANLTQAQAAAELGVSRPLLIAMEKGAREVQPSELIRLAHIYGVQVSALLRPAAPPTAIGTRFRLAAGSSPSAGNVNAEIEKIEALADNYLDLLRRARAQPPGRYPSIKTIDHLAPAQAGEDFAMEERNRLGIGDGPVIQLREILEMEVGLRVFIVPLPSKVAGFFVFVENLGGCVAANADHPIERRRWTMAHEYAHFLVSRTRAEVTTLDARTKMQESERYADAFAANFLMPRNGLTRRFHELKRGQGGNVTPATLVQLAHSYQVSVQALTIRLEDLGLVKAGTWDKLHDNRFQPRLAATRLGLRPHDEGGHYLPLHYRNLAVQLYLDGKITEPELAQYLDASIIEARRIYQELTETRDISEDGAFQFVDLSETSE